MNYVLLRMQVRPLYHKTSIMVSKMKAISLVTVEVGNPRLVWKFSGVRDPGLFPLVALLSLRSCHSLHGRGSSPLPRPFSLKEGEKRGGGEDDTGLFLQGKHSEVTGLISTHFPLARIQSYNRLLLQGSWEIQSYAWAGICPGASCLTVEKRGWMLK